MASVPVTITGVLADKYGRTIQSVTLFGDMVRSDVGVGGGPIIPPPGGGDGGPVHIWGPTDPRPTPPISGIPGLPGYEPGPDPTPPADNVGKPPPPDGGWGWHPSYGWGYFPGTGGLPSPKTT